MGLAGQVRLESQKWAKLQGRLTLQYMVTLGQTIAGGTTEIQKGIIATRGLGLPRG